MRHRLPQRPIDTRCIYYKRTNKSRNVQRQADSPQASHSQGLRATMPSVIVDHRLSTHAVFTCLMRTWSQQRASALRALRCAPPPRTYLLLSRVVTPSRSRHTRGILLGVGRSPLSRQQNLEPDFARHELLLVAHRIAPILLERIDPCHRSPARGGTVRSTFQLG